MAPFIQIEFDRSILLAIGFSDEISRKIVEDTHYGWSEDFINEQNIVARQMLDLLRRTEVLLQPVEQKIVA